MINRIILKDEIEFNGSIHELKEYINLERKKKFDLLWINENEFKILSKISVGTLIMDGFSEVFDGIRGFGNIKENNNGKIRIELKTKIRVELYFVLFSFSFFLLCIYMIGEGLPFWIYLLIPISLIWFWFVLRVQEKRLFKNFKKYITQI